MRLRPFVIAALAAVAGVGPLAAQTPSTTAAGKWRAAVELSDKVVDVYLEIIPRDGGGIFAEMTVPALHMRRVPTGPGSCDRDRVVITSAYFGDAYRGVLASPDRIRGECTPGGQPLTIEYARVDAIPFPLRPQEPRRPYPYRDEDVTFTNSAGLRFHGTLTTPPGPGPHAAAVLLTGMGCQDRDETVFDFRPFFVIADWLTRHGIAVLRFDDRGYGRTAGDLREATCVDLAGDALAAAAFLAARPGIDPAQLGVIGHSEGGMVAMIAASREPRLRFAVSLAGVATPGDEAAMLVIDANAGGLGTRLLGKFALGRVIKHMKSPIPEAELRARIGLLPEPALFWATGPAARFFVSYDPGPDIARIKAPILGIFCEMDRMVPARENAAALAAAASAGGNPDVTIVVVPRLNHLFQLDDPKPADGARIHDTVSPEVLRRLSDWVTAKTRP